MLKLLNYRILLTYFLGYFLFSCTSKVEYSAENMKGIWKAEQDVRYWPGGTTDTVFYYETGDSSQYWWFAESSLFCRYKNSTTPDSILGTWTISHSPDSLYALGQGYAVTFFDGKEIKLKTQFPVFPGFYFETTLTKK